MSQTANMNWKSATESRATRSKYLEPPVRAAIFDDDAFDDVLRIGPPREEVNDAITHDSLFAAEGTLDLARVHVVEDDGAARLERPRDVVDDGDVIGRVVEVAETRKETQHMIE